MIATVRVFRFAFCAAVAVETPVETVTVHSVCAGSTAVSMENVNMAVAVPEFAELTLNVVVPHPFVVIPLRDENENPGKVIATTSSNVISDVSWNMKEIDVAVDVVGVAIFRILVVNAGAATADDLTIAVSVIAAADANDASTFRVARLAC